MIAASTWALMSCTAAPPAPPQQDLFVVQQGESAKALMLNVGQPLILRLQSNPSTGYRWVLGSALEVLQSQGEPAFEAPTGDSALVVGAAGREVWTFLAVRQGQQSLRFEYRRAWEKDAPPAQTLTYYITVR